MSLASRRSFLTANALAALAVTLPALAQAQSAGTRNRVVFQVTDNDPARWNLVLNNLNGMREGVGAEGVEIEVVAYGPGVNMLKADSPAKARIAEALRQGVKINACQNTMNSMKLAPSDMLPDVGYVPSGVVEVMKKQQQGWAYIRP